MSIRAVIVLGAAVVLGCRSRWPEENVLAFKRSCLFKARSSAPKLSDAALIAYCDCAAEKMQARYTFEEMSKREALVLAAPNTDPGFQEVLAQCRALIAP